MIAKAQKPSKSVKFGQGRHSKLPVVAPSHPGRKSVVSVVPFFSLFMPFLTLNVNGLRDANKRAGLL